MGRKQNLGGLYDIYFHNWGARILKYKEKVYWYTYPQKFPYCRIWLFHGKFKCWIFVVFCQEKISKAKFKLIFLKSYLLPIDFHFPGQGGGQNPDHKYLKYHCNKNLMMYDPSHDPIHSFQWVMYKYLWQTSSCQWDCIEMGKLSGELGGIWSCVSWPSVPAQREVSLHRSISGHPDEI